jgi:hypothetical protein
MSVTCYNQATNQGAEEEISARMRVAAFLQPQDPLFFDAGGKAVAVYDYALRLQRA